MGLKEDLAAATVKNSKGVDRGIHVMKKNGNLVLARPGSVQLAADPERGVYLTGPGLKDGDRLAMPEDVAAVAAAGGAPLEPATQPEGEV
jgi:hypothetical protein